jgi:hypothetical protein
VSIYEASGVRAYFEYAAGFVLFVAEDRKERTCPL